MDLYIMMSSYYVHDGSQLESGYFPVKDNRMYATAFSNE